MGARPPESEKYRRASGSRQRPNSLSRSTISSLKHNGATGSAHKIPDSPVTELPGSMPHRDYLEAARAAKPDITPSGASRLKKTLVAREQDRPDVSRHRARWRTCQGLIDFRRLIFIDETWTKINMTRLRKLSAEGKLAGGQGSLWPLEDRDLSRRAAHDRIAAPACSTARWPTAFRAYVEQFLVPTLKPGDAVILHNLGSHKGKGGVGAAGVGGGLVNFAPRPFAAGV